MGSPLGPLSANFYMSHIENKVTYEINPQMKPVMYTRYVNDIFIVRSSLSKLDKLKNALTNASDVSFTQEIVSKSTFSFSVVRLLHSNNHFNASVHVKPTRAEECFNYRSICPQCYKVSAIKTFLHRTHKVSYD